MLNTLYGYSVLKNSGVLDDNGATVIYRLAIGIDSIDYRVIQECRDKSGGYGEMVIYQGDNLESANKTYNMYIERFKK